MVPAIARPSRRSESSSFLFRKRVPADIRPEQAGGKVVVSFPPETGSGEPIRVTGRIGGEVRVSAHHAQRRARRRPFRYCVPRGAAGDPQDGRRRSGRRRPGGRGGGGDRDDAAAGDLHGGASAARRDPDRARRGDGGPRPDRGGAAGGRRSGRWAEPLRPLGSSPMSRGFPGTPFDRLLPDREIGSGAARSEFPNAPLAPRP